MVAYSERGAASSPCLHAVRSSAAIGNLTSKPRVRIRATTKIPTTINNSDKKKVPRSLGKMSKMYPHISLPRRWVSLFAFLMLGRRAYQQRRRRITVTTKMDSFAVLQRRGLFGSLPIALRAFLTRPLSHRKIHAELVLHRPSTMRETVQAHEWDRVQIWYRRQSTTTQCLTAATAGTRRISSHLERRMMRRKHTSKAAHRTRTWMRQKGDDSYIRLQQDGRTTRVYRR